VTEVRADSRLVWRGVTTALARGPGRADAPLSRTETVADSALELTSRIALIPVPKDMGRRYAAIAGDLNPIHQHALLARPFGFERAIVHGTWTLARALAAAGWPTTPAFELEARFRRPVLLPSTIEVMARRSAQGRELLVSGTERVEPHLQARLLRATVYLSAPDLVQLVRRKGLPACIAGVAGRIEADFRRWGDFDKSARVACHSARA
jgi:acyl dehydratase